MKRINSSKLYMGINILFILSELIISNSNISATECTGPTKEIKVTVKQVTASPPTFLYTINNFHKSPIRNFRLGISDHREMEIIPDNIPTEVTSPKGWEGQYIFGEESEYMHIFWLSKDNQSVIAPGASLNGFKIVMPKPSESKVPLFGPNGKPPIPLDMKKAPFDARFEDGACAWGRVSPE